MLALLFASLLGRPLAPPPRLHRPPPPPLPRLLAASQSKVSGGIKSSRLPLPFPPSTAVAGAQAGRIGRRRRLAYPSPVSQSKGRRRGQICPWPLPFSLFPKESLPLSNHFAKETPSFIIFQNKLFHHINLILNKPLPFPE